MTIETITERHMFFRVRLPFYGKKNVAPAGALFAKVQLKGRPCENFSGTHFRAKGGCQDTGTQSQSVGECQTVKRNTKRHSEDSERHAETDTDTTDTAQTRTLVVGRFSEVLSRRAGSHFSTRAWLNSFFSLE